MCMEIGPYFIFAVYPAERCSESLRVSPFGKGPGQLSDPDIIAGLTR